MFTTGKQALTLLKRQKAAMDGYLVGDEARQIGDSHMFECFA